MTNSCHPPNRPKMTILSRCGYSRLVGRIVAARRGNRREPLAPARIAVRRDGSGSIRHRSHGHSRSIRWPIVCIVASQRRRVSHLHRYVVDCREVPVGQVSAMVEELEYILRRREKLATESQRPGCWKLRELVVWPCQARSHCVRQSVGEGLDLRKSESELSGVTCGDTRGPISRERPCTVSSVSWLDTP